MELATNDDDNGCDYDDNDDDDDDGDDIFQESYTTKVLVIPLITLVVPCLYPLPRRSRCCVPIASDIALTRVGGVS